MLRYGNHSSETPHGHTEGLKCVIDTIIVFFLEEICSVQRPMFPHFYQRSPVLGGSFS